MQKLIISGNVGQAAEVRYMPDGQNKVINFSVAVNERWKDKDGVQKERTNWYDCNIWRKKDQSEEIAKYLTPGMKVIVEGKPEAEAYQDKNKNLVGKIKVTVTDLELCSPAQKQEPGQKQQQQQQQPTMVAAGADEADNDLPF